MIPEVSVNGVNVRKAYGIHIKDRSIPLPLPRNSFVDIPGGNGSIDLTTALTDGDVKFQDRVVKVVFTTDGSDYNAARDKLAMLIHGRTVTLVFSDDPGHYFTGRAWIEEWGYDQSEVGEFTMLAQVRPYRYVKDRTRLYFDADGFNTLRIPNRRMWTYATFTAASDLTMTCGQTGYQLRAGVPTALRSLILKEGETAVSFSGTFGRAVTRTNLATNPSFEAAGVTGTLRTNLVTNPSATSAVTGWETTGGGISRGTSGMTGQDNLPHFVATSSGSQGTLILQRGNATGGRINVTGGQWYGLAAFLQNSTGRTCRIEMQWYDAAGTLLSTSASTDIDRQGDRATVVAQAPASAATVLIRALIVLGSGVAGVILRARGFTLVGAASQQTATAHINRQSFDGSTAATLDMAYVWDGPVDASTSRETVVFPTGVTNPGTTALPVQSRQWANSRARSLRVLAMDGVSANTYVSPGGDTGGGFRLGMQAGKTYTFSGTGRLTGAQTAPLSSAARTLRLLYRNAAGTVVDTGSAQLPNAAGSARVSVTVTVPPDATEAFLRAYNGALAGNGDVWWDDLLLEESPTLGDYFDGSTPSAKPTVLYAWSSGADASTSQELTTVPVPVTIDYQEGEL